MSRLEGHFDQALTSFAANPKWDDDDKLKNWIFNLMALLVVRSPQTRENRGEFIKHTARLMMDNVLSSEDVWNRVSKAAREVGDPEISYEQAKLFQEPGNYEISIPNERHIVDESNLIDAVLPCLARRRWTRLITSPQTGLFVTTDNPVVLMWDSPDKVPPLYRDSPGFGRLNTTVHFAISPTLAIFGTFHDEERTIACTSELVSLFNSKLLYQSYGRVFSSTSSIRLPADANTTNDLGEAEVFASWSND